jgi:hypothetical protein
MGNKDKASRKWVSDAMEIDINSIEGMVYTNDKINAFLHQDNALFLSANKGMGKTLLMSFKRFLASSEHPSATFIPRNKPFLDNMSFVNNVSKKMEEYMTEQNATVQMWIFSFQISILSHVKFPFTEANLKHLQEQLPSKYVEYITTNDHWVNPTDIFRELMQGSPNEFIRIRNQSSPLDIAMKQLKSEVRIFIDRVDQALPMISKKTWIVVQGALIDAAWSIFNSNNHIKIYATIRQEAYANYSSPTMPNVTMFELSYEKDELINILNTLARYYENKNSFEEFTNQIKKVNAIGVEENFIDFLIRHTLHRPRDIVKICAGLSADSIRENADAAQDKVVHIANNQVIPYIFSESEVFLDCLRDEAERNKLLSLLTQNILVYDDIMNIFAKVNNLDRNVIGQLELQNPKFCHPFSELYKIGLLGIVTEKNIQRFRMPNDPQNFHSLELPESRYYIIHPALRNYMEVVNSNNYQVFRHIATGHNLKWDEPLNDFLIPLQSKLFGLYDTNLKRSFFKVLDKNFDYIKRNHMLPKGDDIVMLQNALDILINRVEDESVLQNALELMELLECSIQKSLPDETIDLTGFWQMTETYDHGRTSGEVILQQNMAQVTGSVILRDVMDSGKRFSVEEQVIGVMDGKKFLMQGKSVRFIEGETSKYDLDTWSGEVRATDIIVGTSIDAKGVKGRFTMTR